jgi:hypothetical protein
VNDAWLHVCKVLEPQYDIINHMIQNGFQVKPLLTRKGRITVFSLREYYLNEDIREHIDIGQYDDYIEWIDQQLSTWKGVRRMAWDEWYFNKKSDAEKFATLFRLKWAR